LPIEYVVELPCEPKRQFGTDGLRERLRVLERVRAAEVVAGPDAHAAMQAGYDLRPVAFHCARCPANHRQEAFGCFGTVGTPVTVEAEEWLAELLPPTMNPKKAESGQVRRQIPWVRRLLPLLREEQGNPRADAVRGKNGLLERPHPVERRYGWLFSPVRISTSELLEALLFRGQVDPPLGESTCRALAAWVDGAHEAEQPPEAVFTLPVEPRDDASVADLKQLLHALMVGCSLDLPVRTEVATEGPAAGASAPGA